MEEKPMENKLIKRIIIEKRNNIKKNRRRN
jgi:hypothetical protein